jgi:hypothetical protein
MKHLSLLFKKFKLRQLLMVLLAGFVLLFNTACSNVNAQGARPNNPPVQMGGNNNPHKMGGDGYTDYKMSTDPKVNNTRSGAKTGKQASLPESNLIATGGIKSSASDLIYPGSNLSDTEHPDIGPVQAKKLPDLPIQKQPMMNRSEPDAKILERVGEAFKDASSFVRDTADEASKRPETQVNPAIGQ